MEVFSLLGVSLHNRQKCKFLPCTWNYNIKRYWTYEDWRGGCLNPLNLIFFFFFCWITIILSYTFHVTSYSAHFLFLFFIYGIQENLLNYTNNTNFPAIKWYKDILSKRKKRYRQRIEGFDWKGKDNNWGGSHD